MKKENSNSRVFLWDNIKFILILLMVVGHFADVFTSKSDFFKSVYFFIYIFHMPLFIFITGLFHNEKNIKEKVVYYITIGFFLKILLLIANVVINGVPIKFSLLSDGGIPWFMFSLAAFSLLTNYFNNLNKKNILIFWILVALFVGFDKSIGDHLYLSRIIIFYPFYLLGNIIGSEKIIELKSGIKRAPLLLFSYIIIILCLFISFFFIKDIYVLRHLFTGRNYFNASVYNYGPYLRLLCYAITTIVSFSIIMIVPSRKISFISEMGKNTIDIYFWHWISFWIINKVFNITDSFNDGHIGKLLYLLVAVIVTIILSQGGIISYPLKKIKNMIFNNKI